MKEIIFIKRGLKKALKKVSRSNMNDEVIVKWMDSKINLMEIIVLLHESKCLINTKGKPATIMEISNVVFKAFGCEPPKNPTKIIDSLKHRKNPEMISLLKQLFKRLYQ